MSQAGASAAEDAGVGLKRREQLQPSVMQEWRQPRRIAGEGMHTGRTT